MGLKAGGPLFAVRDMKASLRFYQDVLGLAVVQDFGANVVLTGGLSLQTLETWGAVFAEGSQRHPLRGKRR